MHRAGSIAKKGTWRGPAADTVVLDFDTRHRRRLVLRGEAGTNVLLDLPRPEPVADGDALWLDDGRFVRVRAAPEALLKITCVDGRALARIAWHLGNRHLPTEIAEGALFVRYDHVIETMLHGLGADTKRLSRAFQPEGGAYEGASPHGHAHTHHGPHD